MAGVMRLAAAVLLVGCIEPPPENPSTDYTGPHVIVQKYSVAGQEPPPNVTLLLDRSGGWAQRAHEVVAALERVVAERHTAYRFGLAITPWGAACWADAPVVAPGGDGLVDTLRTFGPMPSPLAGAPLAAALAAMPAQDTRRADRVVLFSANDGDGCQGDLPAAVVALRVRGYQTAVVNLGGSYLQKLEDAASEGRVPASCWAHSDCTYLACDFETSQCVQSSRFAPDTASLERVLDELFPPPKEGECTYPLQAMPTSPSRLVVLLDGEKLKFPFDWELVPAGVQIFGEACDRLKQSTFEQRVELELHVDTRP